MKKSDLGWMCGNGKFSSRVGGVITREYMIWGGIFTRCTSEKYSRRFPTYADCDASENFKNFQYFAEWCQGQVGFDQSKWELDKDILIKGNKIYSEDNCVFLPKEINYLFVKRNSERGNLPIGVFLHKGTGKYIAACSQGKNRKAYIGLFNTPQEAFYNYKTVKENYIKVVAEKYKCDIDERLYYALLSYCVDIDD